MKQRSTVPSPFCEAKGGRVERSETQGVHTPKDTYTLPFAKPKSPTTGTRTSEASSQGMPEGGRTDVRTNPLSLDGRGLG